MEHSASWDKSTQNGNWKQVDLTMPEMRKHLLKKVRFYKSGYHKEGVMTDLRTRQFQLDNRDSEWYSFRHIDRGFIQIDQDSVISY